MSSRRLKFFALSLLLFVISLPGLLYGQKLSRLTVGYSAISYDQLPAWVAKETGIFVKNGLDVQLVFFTGGTTALMALVSGDTFISQNAGPEVANAYIRGSRMLSWSGATSSLT